MTAAAVENEKTRQRGGLELGGVPYSETCIRLKAGAMLCTQSTLFSLHQHTKSHILRRTKGRSIQRLLCPAT